MTVVTRGSTYDNISNLAPAFIARVLKKYEGTRLGRQELHAELLEDVPGALWTRERIEANRVAAAPCYILCHSSWKCQTARRPPRGGPKFLEGRLRLSP